MYFSKEDIDFILDNESKSTSELALELRKTNLNVERIEFILKQIRGRQIARKKIESWYNNEEIIYPKSLSMEQASSEQTAIYKLRVAGNDNKSFVDLTGGFGVDFYHLARHSLRSTYLEINKELCEIANHNFGILGLQNFEVVNADGVWYLQNQLKFADIIYLDPSRRESSGRKVFLIEDCLPNIIEIQSDLVNKSKKTIIKYSPMLDIASALKVISNISEVHIISVDNECKELLLVMSKDDKPTRISTTNLRKNEVEEVFDFNLDDEHVADVEYTDLVMSYLYEPNGSILKSGAFRLIAQRFDLYKLHLNSHLYTSNELRESFPGRAFEVVDYFTPSKRNIAEFCKKNKKANITVRNYPKSVAEIRRASKIEEGGELYIFATTLKSNSKVWIVCRKV